MYNDDFDEVSTISDDNSTRECSKGTIGWFGNHRQEQTL